MEGQHVRSLPVKYRGGCEGEKENECGTAPSAPQLLVRYGQSAALELAKSA